MDKIEKPCGTYSKYRVHLYRKEKPCFDCTKAANDYARELRNQNRKKYNEYMVTWRKNNPEKAMLHKQKSLENVKCWPQKNRERSREIKRNAQNRRKANKLQNGIDNHTEQQVIDLYGTNCHICHKTIDFNASRWVGRGNWEQGFHKDHLIPLSKGGSDTIDNVRPSHALCNIRKHNKIE